MKQFVDDITGEVLEGAYYSVSISVNRIGATGSEVDRIGSAALELSEPSLKEVLKSMGVKFDLKPKSKKQEGEA